MTAWTIFNGIDFGRKDVQFTANGKTCAHGHRSAKRVFVLGELFGQHLVPESGNNRYSLLTTLLKIPMDVWVIEMFVDVRDNYPIGNATTFFSSSYPEARPRMQF